MWILRVYLRSGPVVELIYDGADACRKEAMALNSIDGIALRDSYGKVLTIQDKDQIAGAMISDYDAELSGVDQIEKCKAGLRAKMQQRAAAQAGLIGAGPMLPGRMGGNGGIIHG